MKSLLKKVLVLVIAMACALGSFMGCGGDNGDDDGVDPVDPTRTQVYVLLINDGLGIEWMQNDIKKAFEAKFPQYQLMVDPNYRDSDINSIATSNFDVFLNARDSYRYFANSGNLADITTWVKEKVYDSNFNYVGQGGTVSAFDRMTADYQKLYDVDGKIYAVPHYEGTWGIWYDYDLLHGEGLIPNESYGNGPDGIEGTPDDGLPRTWKEFLSFLGDVRDSGFIPFSFSNIEYVRNGMLDAFIAGYEGKNDFDINFSLSGTLDNPVKDDLGNDIYEINCQPGTANFVHLQKQEGRLAALTMINEFVNPDNCSIASYKGQQHTDAQTEFLQSVQVENKGQRVAMFMEGAYWHNEARPTFNAMGTQNSKYGYGEREFRYLALPKFDGTDTSGVPATTNTGRTTLYNTGSDAFVFVNKKSENSQAVKDFYQWFNGNEGCFYFTKGSNCFRTIESKFTPEQVAELSPMSQDLYRYRYAEHTDVCYELSTCKTRYDQYNTFLQFNRQSKVGTNTTNNPWSYFKDNPGKASVQAYFSGMYTYWTSSAVYSVLG